jgi:predicted metal-dependent hydrolase
MQLALPLLTTEPLSPQPPRGDAGTIFVRHRRARRYILRVLDDGTLRVTLPQRGSKREALAFVEKNVEWIARQRERTRLVSTEPRSGEGGRDPLAEHDARQRGLRELPAMLLALAKRHDITVTRVSIRNQRSRWGACSARGSITLNWRLILVPGFVRDYVMIHELMHRRELNHSKRFWAHVGAACPHYREARQWLLTEGQQYFS